MFTLIHSSHLDSTGLSFISFDEERREEEGVYNSARFVSEAEAEAEADRLLVCHLADYCRRIRRERKIFLLLLLL